MTDKKIYCLEYQVHCLSCDDVYWETPKTSEICPTCGNPDKNWTVYLELENYHYNCRERSAEHE
tara:strand:+ start:1314 stop:1505 length:192 start_codon:yes stop_codon:yes gene_type:complete